MPTKDDILEIGVGILAIRETTQGIRKALGKEVKRDKKATTKKQGFLRRMFAKKKKEDSEKMIESKKKKSFIGKGVTAVAAAGKSFMERLFGAAAALLVGFLVTNLPKLIEEIQKVVEWLKNVKDWVENFIDKVRGVSKVVISTVKDWISGIRKQFGFERQKDEVEKKMDELNKTAQSLNKDWQKDQERLKKDIEKAEKEGRESVEGLPSSQTDVVEESNDRSTQIQQLQEQRDSGEITPGQYQKKVNEIYEPSDESSDDFQTINNQIDRNSMSPSEFFGTNEFGDSDNTNLDETLSVNTEVESLGDTNIKKEESVVTADNNGGVNFVGTNTNTEVVENKPKKKMNVYSKFGTTARFSPPGYGLDGLSKEEAKTLFVELHNNDRRSSGENFDYQQLEVLLHDKFNVNTSAMQIEGTEEFLKNFKRRFKPDEMNLIGPTGGKVVNVPIEIPKNKINNGGKTVVANSSQEGEMAEVIISSNPIKKINQFNRHFS